MSVLSHHFLINFTSSCMCFPSEHILGVQLQRQGLHPDPNLLRESWLRTGFILISTCSSCGCMITPHRWLKSVSTPPLSFHCMSWRVGGAMSMATSKSGQSVSCSLMALLDSSLVPSTKSLLFLFPLIFSDEAEHSQEPHWGVCFVFWIKQTVWRERSRPTCDIHGFQIKGWRLVD